MTASSVFNDMIATHFITLLLIVVYAIKLSDQKKASDAELRYFWMTVICCLLLVLEDECGSLCAMDPALRLPRTIFSIVGYTLRPVAAIGLLLVVCPPERRNWKLWIPAIINLAVFPRPSSSPPSRFPSTASMPSCAGRWATACSSSRCCTWCRSCSPPGGASTTERNRSGTC